MEGLREMTCAVRAGVPMVEVFVAPELVEGEAAVPLLKQIALRAIPCHEVSREVFEKLAFGDRVEGVLGVARICPKALDELALPLQPIVAVLEGVEKPGNLGAIARTADAAGVSALVIVGGGTDAYNPNAIRASLGTLLTLPLAQADAEATLSWAKGLGMPIVAARPDAATEYTEVDLASGAVLLLGSEAEGLGQTWRDPAVTPIRLPMCGVADSLNVSAAAAVLFYEALRQRREETSPRTAEPTHG